MKNIFNKTNAPYLVSGALAIGTLLASGIFAVALYVGFLAPVAALNLGLPFIVGSAVLSTVIMGLSIVGIWQKRTADKTISEKDAQLTEKVKEIEDKNSQVVLQEEIILKRTKEANAKEKEISKLEAQLVEKNKELKDKDTVIPYLDAQSVKKDAEMQEQLDKKAKYIINSDEDARRIHQVHKERNREEVLSPVAFSDLFDESPSSENHSTQNGQSWTEWYTDKAKTAAQLAMRGAMFAAVAATYIYTFFEQPEISPAGQTLFQSKVGNHSTGFSADSVLSFILREPEALPPFGMRTASH